MIQNNDMEQLSKDLAPLCDNLTNAVSALSSNHGSRASVISAAQAIIHAAQGPQDLYVHFVVNKCEIIVMRLFLKWEVFQEIPPQGSISFTDLAAKIDAEVGLVARLSRMLIASGMLSSPGPDRVAHTHRSRMIAEDPLFRSTAKLILYEDFPQAAGTPEYFASRGRREPTDRTDTAFHFRRGEQPGRRSAFDLINEDPALLKIIMEAMVRTQDFLASPGYDFSWLVSPTSTSSEKAGDGDNGDGGGEGRTLLVDVGGGAGHTIREILQRTPELAAERCVLQDTREVIERAKRQVAEAEGPAALLRGVRMMEVDFHAEQPVKGAKAYLIRRCLHNYSDGESVGILRQIREAMASDSTLLVMEMVLLPESPPFCYAMDMAMMGIAGKERTLEDWRAIAAEAGLRINRVVPAPGIGVSVIECVKEA